MDVKELSTIKQYQKQFKTLFGKRLEIDWNAMNDNSPSFGRRKKIKLAPIYDVEEILKSCADKFGADIDKIKSRECRLHKSGNSRERRTLQEFSKIILESRINVGEAAKIVNRDRTLLYHYANYYEE